MPIFKRQWGGAAALAALLGLGACLPADEMAGRSRYGHDAVAAIRVAQNQITVVGPEGYCVDTKGSSDRKAGSFVLLGSCAALKGGKAAGPEEPAVLTALISPEAETPQSPSVAQLERFFRSDAGRAALAHDNIAAKVTLLEIQRKDDMLVLKVRDRSKSRPADLRDTSWRAVFGLKGRMVALAVHSHDAMPMKDAEMRRTLGRFVTAMRAANGAGRTGGKT